MPVESPIERAARAMYANVSPDWDWHDPDAELLRKMYRENARVAISAVREPSEEMIRIGSEIIAEVVSRDENEGSAPVGEFSGGAIDTFSAMIDAALEEG